MPVTGDGKLCPWLCTACSGASSFLLLRLPAFLVLQAPHPMRNVVNCADQGMWDSLWVRLLSRKSSCDAYRQKESCHSVVCFSPYSSIIFPWLLKPRTLMTWKNILDLLLEDPFLFTENSALFQVTDSLPVDLSSNLQYSSSRNRHATHPPQVTPGQTLSLYS